MSLLGSQRPLLSLDLVNITPALVGSWLASRFMSTGDRCLLEPPRPTDIAGKMRWWMRSLIGGMIYNVTGRFPTLAAADRAASLLLGDVKHRGGMASRYMIRVRPMAGHENLHSTLENHRYSYDERLAGIPRVKLQTLGKTGYEELGQIPLPPGAYRFRVELWRRPGARTEPWMDDLAAVSLLAALFMTGIGRMTSRGFGKLKLLNATSKNDMNSIIEFIKMIVSGAYSDFIQNIVNITNYNQVIEKIEDGIELTTYELCNAPPYPTTAPGYIYWKEIKLTDVDMYKILAAISLASNILSRERDIYIECPCLIDIVDVLVRCGLSIGDYDNRIDYLFDMTSRFFAKICASVFFGWPRGRNPPVLRIKSFDKCWPSKKRGTIERLSSTVQVTLSNVLGSQVLVLVYGFRTLYNDACNDSELLGSIKISKLPCINIYNIIEYYTRCISQCYLNYR